MLHEHAAAPDTTAVRTALWRALHVEVDAPPHVFEDVVGMELVAPDDGWRSRPDMSPFTRPFRASIVLGLGVATFLRFVPVDFEAGTAWWRRLVAAGFDAPQAAVVASTGVSMSLTRDAIVATLRQVAALAPGSTFVMSFILPLELLDPTVRPGVERAADGARASGTPFISFFTPTEMLALASDAGFKKVWHVSAAARAQRYFAGRTDGLSPPNNSEELLVATT